MVIICKYNMNKLLVYYLPWNNLWTSYGNDKLNITKERNTYRHRQQWKGHTNTYTQYNTHTGLSSFDLLYPQSYLRQLFFLATQIFKDWKICWITTFCRSCNLAETIASQVLGSISVCACVVVTLGWGEAGHCSEYTAEMTWDLALVQVEETMPQPVNLCYGKLTAAAVQMQLFHS